MAGHNLSDVSLPSINDLQTWANDQELARGHLKQIFAALESSQEEPTNWATEALENMGPPLSSDIPWLGTIVSSDHVDSVYWAVTVLGRSEDSIDSVQDAIAKAFMASGSTLANRRRAMTALSKVREKSSETASAIQAATNSEDSQLKSMAKEILQSV